MTENDKHSSLLHYWTNYGCNLFRTAESWVLAIANHSIKLGWKWLTMTNTLAYYTTELIMALNDSVLQKARVLAIASHNIKLGWKWLKMKNTLAYYTTELITAVINSILQNARAFAIASCRIKLGWK